MSKYGEISWEDDYSNSNGEKRTNSNVKDSWLKLQEGSNVVRLITKPHQYIVHKGVKKKGDKGYGQKVNCANPDGKGSCAVCDLGYQAGQRWFLGVIDRKTGQYNILDTSYQVYSQIRKLARKAEVWGDPTKYDIDIVVDKAGGPTGYYSVQPVPHKPLSAADLETVAKANVADLVRRTTPPTPEFVAKKVETLLEGQPAELPPKKAGAKSFTSGVAKKANTPEVPAADDSEDDVNDIFPEFNG